MAMRTNDSMRQWALRGAEQRLLEIAQEVTAIHAAFPELRQTRRGRPPANTTTDAAPRTPTRRRRRKLSAEARKRISDAQKARWAKQKSKR